MMGKIETASEQLERFYTEILPPDLASARGITYARLAAFATEHNLRIERRNGSSDYEEESDLMRLRVTMLLTGEWPDIRAFIAAVEEASEFVVIQEVVLRSSEEKAAALGLALTVSTYYQHDAEPDRS
jgi:Tfp pilus assembly protein PilO